MNETKKIGIVVDPKTFPLKYYEKMMDLGFNNIVFVNPINLQIDETIDILIGPGGADVAIDRQPNVIPHIKTQNPNTFLEFFDRNVLPEYIKKGVKIIGICREMQSLWVHFGGILHQHIDFPVSSPRGELIEELTVKLPWTDEFKVKINSLHHQAVAEDTGSEMIVIGRNQYGTAEVIMHPNQRIFGFQYHPEEIDDEVFNEVLRFLTTN